jgi:PIN domain nuclease of toxin-antitoxin system
VIYVLDTHAMAWYVDNDPRLSKAADAAIQDPIADLVIPTIAMVEIRYLHAKGRIQSSPAMIEQKIISARKCKVHPLDEDVVSLIPIGLDIHDSIIVATAIFYRDILRQPTTLITKDRAITQSGLIQILW